MALKEQITDDMKTAMRARNSARLGTIRLLLAAIKQKEVDERISLDDGAVIGVVDKLLKQRRDAIVAYEAANRADLADQERAEALVLQAYLPQRLSAAEVLEAVQGLLAELTQTLGHAPTPADMGRVMGLAKERLGAQADMATVSAAVKQSLGR